MDIKYSNIETEEQFIDLIRQIDNVNTLDDYSQTLLYNTARKGFLEASKILCKLGADINAYDGTMKYDNVLNAACISKKRELIYYLLDRGAKVPTDCTTTDGLMIMHGDGIIALLFDKQIDMVKVLLEKGWSVNSSSLNGTLAEMIIYHQKPELLELLMQKGYTLTRQDVSKIFKIKNFDEFVEVILKSEYLNVLFESAFLEASNNLHVLDEIVLPWSARAVLNMGNFDLTPSFEWLFAETIELHFNKIELDLISTSNIYTE